MLKFDGGVGSSRYSSPGVLGFFFTIAGFFRWLRCVSEAKYRFNGLRFCLNNINLELFLSYTVYRKLQCATMSQIARVDHVTVYLTGQSSQWCTADTTTAPKN